MLEYIRDESKFEIRPFCDQRGIAHIQILDTYTDVTSIHRIKSKYIRLLLIGQMYDIEEKAPNDAAISSAINVLMAMALKGPILPLHNRVAQDGDTFWLDMCTPTWDAIKTDKDGWEVTRPPPIFRRYNNQNPLPIPSKNGSIIPLLKLLKFDNLGDQLLFVVSTITNLIPDISHMVSMVHGPQGGGKSFLHKFQKSLIDPGKISAYATIPKNVKEFIRILEQNYIMVFDNVSYLSQFASDVFCSSVTGAGQDFRELYTDFDSIIFEFRRCVFLNGISIPGTSPDLLDRSGIFRQDIKSDELLTEKIMNKYLDENSPIILGGMLDCLVKAINYYPEMEKTIKFKHRLTDFTVWGCAVTKALGLDHNLFLDSFYANVNNQKIEALNASPVADCLRHFLSKQEGTLLHGEWSGSASQLYTELKEVAQELKISTAQKSFPKNPTALGKELTKLEPNLPAIGYKVNRDRTGKQRTIRLLKTQKQENFFKPLDWGLGPDLVNYLELGLSSPYKPDKETESELPQSLQNQLDEFMSLLSKIEKEIDGEPVDFNLFIKELVGEGWKASDVKRIREVLQKQDGKIYEPRPGFIKRCIS